MAERIGVETARERMAQGAWLICAYDDDGKCAKLALEGMMPLSALRGQAAGLPRDQELIFYCA
jgi:hypothetical protein